METNLILTHQETLGRNSIVSKILKIRHQNLNSSNLKKKNILKITLLEILPVHKVDVSLEPTEEAFISQEN